MKVVFFAAVFLLAVVYKAECAITEWTYPVISGANGAATAADQLAEDDTAGTTAVIIQATTATGYVILSQDPTAADSGVTFTIAAATGVISFTGTLDYEAYTSFLVAVEATDAGGDTGTADVTIEITDVNDNNPEFGETLYAVCMDDGSAIDKDVIRMTATDADGTDNAISLYDIAGGNTGSDFQIDANGLITVAVALDKTRTVVYELVVEAEDSGTPVATGTTTVFVSVTSPTSDAVPIISGMVVTMIAFLVARFL